MITSDLFDRILISLHDAMLDDAHWPRTSALIDEACGMMGNELIVGEGFGEDARILFAGFFRRGERRQDLERLYFDTYYPRDERLPRLRALPDSRLVHVRELYTDDERKNSATYNEELPRSGTRNGLNVRLDGPGGTRIVWSLADPLDPGGWGSDQIGLIERLLPHVRHFVQVRGALAGAHALGASLSDLLDNNQVGAIHLDRRGRIIEMNGRAHRMLRHGDGLFGEDDLLRARLPADDARLQTLMGRALPAFGGPGAGGSMTVRRPSGLSRLSVHLSPVSAPQLDFGLRHVAVLALVIDADSRPRVDPARVAVSLGLTPAQSQVAALMAEGMSVSEVATATGRKANAVYFLLKQIYKRQGISRQAELVRLVLSLTELSSPRH